METNNTTRKRTAIVGGGAAGFFCAIHLGEMCPDMDITIMEQQKKVLAKVEISGGGRCNCTNTFAQVSDLTQVYPRGAKLLKRLFKQFGPEDAYSWFEEHGVPLVVQEDQCVFPKAQDSHAIIDTFLRETRRLGVRIHLERKVNDIEVLLRDFDYVVVTTGGMTPQLLSLLKDTSEIQQPVPSLFTFNIKDKALQALMGVVVENAMMSIPGTKFKSEGALLITHWGMSGPATLKLSSHAARHLAEQDYKCPLAVNWAGEKNADLVRETLTKIFSENSARMIENIHPYGLQSRLWEYLLAKTELTSKRCSEVGKKGMNRLVETLVNDQFHIANRCHYKEEFVTCGGIALSAVDKQTLESKTIPHLYFAGEILDVDGVTGGFNLQAAWTMGYAVARGIRSTL